MKRKQEKRLTKRHCGWLNPFFDSYATFLSLNFHLKEDDTHQEIMSELEWKPDVGMDVNRAIQKITVQQKAKFDQLFEENALMKENRK